MTFKTREQWLQAAVAKVSPWFVQAGHALPEVVRVACGWPSVGGTRTSKRVLGEAWSPRAAKDSNAQIFVSPYLEHPLEVLAVLVHELVHVAVGNECGHRGAFVKVGEAVGLQGPWRSTTVNDARQGQFKRITEALGDYPNGSLNALQSPRKKDTTRMLKANCPHCGYTVRLTLKWILMAVPVCPDPECEHFQCDMECTLPDDETVEDRTTREVKKVLNLPRPSSAKPVDDRPFPEGSDKW